MPTTHRQFSLVSLGFVLVWLDFKIGSTDMLPDVLGYVLMVVGVIGVARFHPAFRIAALCAAALGVFELYSIYFMQPVTTAVPTIGGIPPLENEPFRLSLSVSGVITAVLDLAYSIAIAHGLYVFFAQRGDTHDSDTALIRRNQFVHVGILAAVSALVALAVMNVGAILLILTLLVEIVLSLSLIVLIQRASRAPRTESLLTHLVAPMPRRHIGVFDWWRNMLPTGRWIVAGAGVGFMVLVWALIVPCSSLDKLIRKSGCVALIDQHDGLMTGFAFAPDSRSIATNSDGHVRLIELESGNTIYEWGDTQPSFANQVAVSPDGLTIAAGRRDGIDVWRPGVLSVHVDLDTDGEFNGTIAFAPDGSLLAAADDDGNVYIWRTENGSEVHRLEGFTERPMWLQFSAQGTLVAATQDRISEWRVDDGSLVQSNELPSGDQLTAISADGATFAAVGDGSIEVRSVRSGEQVNRLARTNGDSYFMMAFSHGGEYLATLGSKASRSNTDQITLYRTADGVEVGALQLPGVSTYGVRYLQFSPDDQLIAVSGMGVGSGGNNVGIWRVP